MKQSEGLAWPVKVGAEVYLNQYKVNDDLINYWININGETVALTRAQYIGLYEARLELWDDVARRTEERIIKLLERASIGFEQFDSDSVATTNFLIRLIKGEK